MVLQQQIRYGQLNISEKYKDEYEITTRYGKVILMLYCGGYDTVEIIHKIRNKHETIYIHKEETQ